ncbi:MAG: ubiquinone/menaquinone biosynthesis methyltransferase [Candidatus Riflebacteria bacterium]|nr:ubiquinone/menaquinone biosynthesis methyltransferase [Candidatus Riflebacteria bacterium]
MSVEKTPVSISTKAIRQFFSEISSTYDFVNSLCTLGLDFYWRKMALKLALPSSKTKTSATTQQKWLDVCAGTGKMTLNLAEKARNDTEIVALDFSSQMLSHIKPQPNTCSIQRCLADVKQLPFPDATFDLVTLSFATRNLHSNRTDLIRCFSEIQRVIKPGGRFLNLETSQPENKIINELLHFFVETVVPNVGAWFSGSPAPYRYLASSMKAFYNPNELADLLSEAGFRKVAFKQLTFGTVAAHLSWKA